MRRGPTGAFEVSTTAGEAVRAFVPAPLPPVPSLSLGGELAKRLESATLSLGRLDSISTLLPDPFLFLYTYVRKEAVLSSQIEGTQSSLSDLLLFEHKQAPGVPLDDVREASNYVLALEHGLARLREGFPLVNRLLREIHGKLLASGRGSVKSPGDFRRSQNWIGGTRPGDARFVPPPPHRVQECMSALEAFLHDESHRLPSLIRAGLAHVQFETIHPFLDGNGRIGRLLITLILCEARSLKEPLLYLSLYFKTNRSEYYERLQRVRDEGEWEEWMSFYLYGVQQTADGAVTTAKEIVAMFEADRTHVASAGRRAGSALRVHHALQERAIATMGALSERTGLSFPAVSAAMDLLSALGIVREVTGKKRGRVYAYDRYLELLSEGTEPE